MSSRRISTTGFERGSNRVRYRALGNPLEREYRTYQITASDGVTYNIYGYETEAAWIGRLTDGILDITWLKGLHTAKEIQNEESR